MAYALEYDCSCLRNLVSTSPSWRYLQRHIYQASTPRLAQSVVLVQSVCPSANHPGEYNPAVSKQSVGR